MSKTSFRLILIFLSFAPLLEGGQNHVAFMIYRIIIILLLALYILEGITHNRLLFYRSGLEWPIFAFLAVSLLTTIRSPYINMSMQWLLSILFAIIFFYLLLSLIRNEKEISSVLGLLFCLGVIEAIIALGQFFLSGLPRAKGTFSNPNFLALYITATGSLGLGTLLAKGSLSLPLPRPLVGFSLIIILLAIMTTGSRGGLIVLSLILIFFFWIRFGKKSFWAVLLLIAAISLIPSPIHDRIFHAGIGDSLRPEVWKVSLKEMLYHPMGIGPGIYNYLSYQYDLPIEGAVTRYGKRAGSTHNDYLQIGVELGLAGLTVFLIGLFKFANRLRKALILPDYLGQKGFLWGLSGGIIAILIHTALDAILHEPALVILLTTYSAIFLILERGHSNIRATTISPLPIRHRSLIIGIAALIGLLIIRPTFAWYLIGDGNMALEKGDIPYATRRFEQALIFDKGNAYYHDALAYTYFSEYKLTGDLETFNKAVSELKYASSLNPLEGKFPAAIGTLYFDLAGKVNDPSKRSEALRKALAYYQDAAKLHPFFPFRYNDLGLVYKNLNEYEIAIRQFERAIKIEPMFLPARTNLAILYKEEGRYQDAKREFDAILTIKERYRNSTLDPLEEQYLALDERKIQEELSSLLGIKGESSRHDTPR